MSDANKEKVNLNVVNLMNIILFSVHVILSYGFGTQGWLGVRTNSDQSNEYQTIITPSGSAFSIWGLIYLSQGVFCVVQLLPSYRSTPLVQKGVKYWFILTLIFQSAWIFAFGYDNLYAALVIILLVGVFLISLLVSQYYVESYDKNILNYWLLQFPFEIHCGWIITASVLSVNVIIVSKDYDEVVQATAGIISLAILLIVATFVLFSPKKPNYTIPIVFSWASGWIYNELGNPKESITNLFDTFMIEVIQYVSIIVSIIVLAMVIVRMIISLTMSYAPFIFVKQGLNEEKNFEGSPVLDENLNNALDREQELGLPL